MALSTSVSESRILHSSAALFRIRDDIRETSEQTPPRLLQKYQSAQQNSCLAPLPEELELLVFSILSSGASANALGNLGRTSNYWHLKVRNYIENHSGGDVFRRSFETHEFLRRFSCTPVGKAKQLIADNCHLGFRHHLRFSRTVAEIPFPMMEYSDSILVVQINSDAAASPAFEKKLAQRKGGLTLFDLWTRVPDAQVLIKAIEAIPRGAFAAIALPFKNFPASDAQALAKTMKEHPVVCLIAEVDSHFERFAEGAESKLLEACADNRVEGVTFRFSFTRFDEENGKALSDAICKFKTGVCIEISDTLVSREAMSLVIEAARSHNKSSESKVTLKFFGATLRRAAATVDSLRDTNLEDLRNEEIHFIDTVSRRDKSLSSEDSSDESSEDSEPSVSAEASSYSDCETEEENQ